MYSQTGVVRYGVRSPVSVSGQGSPGHGGVTYRSHMSGSKPILHMYTVDRRYNWTTATVQPRGVTIAVTSHIYSLPSVVRLYTRIDRNRHPIVVDTIHVLPAVNSHFMPIIQFLTM